MFVGLQFFWMEKILNERFQTVHIPIWFPKIGAKYGKTPKIWKPSRIHVGRRNPQRSCSETIFFTYFFRNCEYEISVYRSEIENSFWSISKDSDIKKCKSSGWRKRRDQIVIRITLLDPRVLKELTTVVTSTFQTIYETMTLRVDILMMCMHQTRFWENFMSLTSQSSLENW